MDAMILPDPKMEAYKRVYKYKEPYTAICAAEFVHYVQVTLGHSLADSLQTLLGGKVQMITTLCLLNAVRLLHTDQFIRYSSCDHSGTSDFPCDDHKGCMRSFVNKFPGRRLVICTIHETSFYKSENARIVVTNDCNHGIKIDSIAEPDAPIEFKIMDEYHRIMRYSPPFYVVCQPAFVGYLQDLRKNITHTLQTLLGGDIRLLVTNCIRSEMFQACFDTSDFGTTINCPHMPWSVNKSLTAANCMRRFVLGFRYRYNRRKPLVVCVMDDIEHYKLDPHTIVVTPNPDRDGIMLDTSANESLVIAAKSRVESDKMLQTPATTHSTGTKTVFMGNLRFSIKENDIVDFFKDVGEVAEVRFGMRDEHFAGYGHVEFTTSYAAQKAIELNGANLLGRYVEIDLAKERGEGGEASSYTPGRIEGSYQKNCVQGRGHSVFVRVTGEDHDIDSLRATLEGQCGEISRLLIPKEYNSDFPNGIAFIEFADNKGVKKALKLSGTEVRGGYISITEAESRGGTRGTQNIGSEATSTGSKNVEGLSGSLQEPAEEPKPDKKKKKRKQSIEPIVNAAESSEEPKPGKKKKKRKRSIEPIDNAAEPAEEPKPIKRRKGNHQLNPLTLLQMARVKMMTQKRRKRRNWRTYLKARRNPH